MHAVLQGFGENSSTNFEAAVDAGKIRTFNERTGYPHAIHRLIKKLKVSIPGSFYYLIAMYKS